VDSQLKSGTTAFEDALKAELEADYPGATIDVTGVTSTSTPPSEPKDEWKAMIGIIIGVIILAAFALICFGGQCFGAEGFSEDVTDASEFTDATTSFQNNDELIV